VAPAQPDAARPPVRAGRPAEDPVLDEKARAARLAELKARIRAGAYQIDDAAVAKKLLHPD